MGETLQVELLAFNKSSLEQRLNNPLCQSSLLRDAQFPGRGFVHGKPQIVGSNSEGRSWAHGGFQT